MTFFCLFIISSFLIFDNVFAYYIENKNECLIIIKISKVQVFYGINNLYNNLSSCLDNCMKNISCVGVDYDNMDPGCFWFFSLEERVFINNNVTHYFVLRNQTGCQGYQFRNDTWSPLEGMKWEGKEIKIKENATFSECAKACYVNPKCRGLNLKKNKEEDPLTCSLVGQRGFIVQDSNYYYFPRPFHSFAPIHSKDRLPGVLTIKPAYILLIGIGIGCILLTIISVVVLCSRNFFNSSMHQKSNKVISNNERMREREDGSTISNTFTKPEKRESDFKNATFTSLDFANSVDAGVNEVITENERF